MFAKRGIHTIPDALRIWGGEGEREGAPEDDTGGEQAGGEELSGGEVEQGSADGGERKADDQEAGKKTPTLEEQLDAERRRNLKLQRDLNKSRADKEAAEADKDAAKERDTYKARLDKAEQLIENRLKIWSIETNKKYQWENAEDVLAFIKPDEIHIDLEADDPKVEGLDLALKRIAKEKPYLLKKTSKEEEQEEGPPSGAHLGNGSVTDAESEIHRLGQKFKIPGYGAQSIRPV